VCNGKGFAKAGKQVIIDRQIGGLRQAPWIVIDREHGRVAEGGCSRGHSARRMAGRFPGPGVAATASRTSGSMPTGS